MTALPVSRRRLLQSGAALGAASLSGLAAADPAPVTRFLVVGDWGRRGHHHQRAVAAAMAARAEADDPAFIVSAGDNFYEAGVASVDDPQWRASFEDVYDQPSLQRPWHVILGNHDYRGNVEAQIAYSARSPRWQLPARYYVRRVATAGGALDIFYLDTSPFIRKYLGTSTHIEGQDPHAQRAWLDRSLGASAALFFNDTGPPQIYTTLGGLYHDQPDLIAAIDPVLKRHDVRLYINGHDHTLQCVTLGAITYATTGAGSETYWPFFGSRKGFVSGSHGFLACALHQDGAMKLDFIDARRRVLYRQTVAL